MATEMITFNCGHTDEVKPGVFGRGQARIKRMEAYSARPCYACAVQAVPAYVYSLTMSVQTGEKYSGAPAAAKIADKIETLRVRYLMTVNQAR